MAILGRRRGSFSPLPISFESFGRARRARAANNRSLPSLLGLCTHAMQGGKREINREGSDEDIYFWQKTVYATS